LTGTAALPLDAVEFAALMQRFEPFEPAPRLAVAVSGGADSLALALLTDEWARRRGGAITALTVDHRLRAASAGEAAQAGAWLAARGVPHRVLVRDAAGRAAGGVQAAARAARYALLEGWCATTGVLHLLTAHHREDQAETMLLRLARGSGLDGLAGMAAVREGRACRILRPLLGVARERLSASLRRVGQNWIEDPSNEDTAYARVRLRQAMPSLGGAGLGAERLAAAAAGLGRARTALEIEVAALLARAASIHPAGFVRLDADRLLAVPAEIGCRALAAVLATVGGADHPPRLERLERLYRQLRQGLGGGRTLGGCRVLPRRGGTLVCREPAAMAPPVPASPGETVTWDRRFRLRLPADAPRGLALGPLGEARSALAARLPAAVRPSVAALYDDKAVVAVPAVGYVREGVDGSWLAPGSLLLRPTRPLTTAGFTVV
jgi:tRNA(Ile)-lysidine synthase